MDETDIYGFSPDSTFHKHLGRDVWVMDDHRWAFYIWEKIRFEHFPADPFHLIHADYHWDHIDYFDTNSDLLDELLSASLETLQDWTVRDAAPIRYDSFIAPAVRRKSIKTIHWFCKQEEEDNGFDSDFLEAYDCPQYFYPTSLDLGKASIKSPLIFDLCLDLFNRNDKDMWVGDIWPNEEIEEFLSNCEALIQQASGVTVSLSFGYSGSKDDTRRLVSVVIPAIARYRAD